MDVDVREPNVWQRDTLCVVGENKADRKFKALNEYLFEDESINSIYCRYDIVNRTFCKWLYNYKEQGYTGLKDLFGDSRMSGRLSVKELIAELRIRTKMGYKNVSYIGTLSLYYTEKYLGRYGGWVSWRTGRKGSGGRQSL